MTKSYKDHVEYAKDLFPTLDAALSKQRDLKFEAALGEAFALFGFVMLEFETKATSHVELFEFVGIMLIELEDVLRGLFHGQHALSPVTLATLTRVAMELRCKLKFIFSRADPAAYADRYFRHTMIELLVKDERQGGRLLSKEQREAFINTCQDWITVKNGKRKYSFNWNADPAFNSVARIASEVGLAADYDAAYSMTSSYVHGSAALIGLYGDVDGNVGSLGRPLECKQMAYLAVNYCMENLRDASKFFGVPLDIAAFSRWQERLVAACPELEPEFIARPVEKWEQAMPTSGGGTSG